MTHSHYELKLTDEKRENLANVLGFDQMKMAKWVKSQAKNNTEGDTKNVIINDCDIDKDGMWVDTDWYFVSFSIERDERGDPYPRLEYLIEKGWGMRVRSGMFEDSEEGLPYDETHLQAAKEFSEILLEEWVETYGFPSKRQPVA